MGADADTDDADNFVVGVGVEVRDLELRIAK